MPVSPTYPGVYLEEIPSAVHTITGVSTSVAAFIDYFKRGPLNKAVQIFSMGDFTREFGGLDSMSEASYAIQQFFLNGGGEAWVVRVASGSVAQATVGISSEIDKKDAALTVKALNEGRWGNDLYVSIEHQTPASQNLFNMTVLLMEERDGRKVVAKSEVFRNLSMQRSDPNFVGTVINDALTGSKLVSVATEGTALPLPTGTLSEKFATSPTLSSTEPKVGVKIEDNPPVTATLWKKPTTLAQARKLLESAIRAACPQDPLFAQATVSIVDNRLLVLAGLSDISNAAKVKVKFTSGDVEPTASTVGWLSGAKQLQGLLSSEITTIPAPGQLNITIVDLTKTLTLKGNHKTLDEVRAELQEVIRSADDTNEAFKSARVALHTDGGKSRLLVLSGNSDSKPGDVTFSNKGDDTTASNLGLVAPIPPGSGAVPVTALVSAPLPATVLTMPTNAAINVKIGEVGVDAEITLESITEGMAESLQTAIWAYNPTKFSNKVWVMGYIGNEEHPGKARLIILSDNPKDTISITAAVSDVKTVAALQLENATTNVQLYHLGESAPIPGSAQIGGILGTNGTQPNAAALIGDEGDKTGLYALEAADLFNILCIPRVALLEQTEANSVLAVATRYCEKRRAFFVMDTPNAVDELQGIKAWLNDNATTRHQNAALYFPRVKIADPLNNSRLRSVGASGTIAGLYARTDSTRGVWKAPAGTEATLSGVQALDCKLTDPENGALNPLAINCLRNLPVYGNVSWGARTLYGSDQQASEWKYIPVRRTALYIEESLFRGLQWAVFEPNDEELWSQIRLNVNAFMQTLYRRGAFQGSTPMQAFFVKCDRDTNPQENIDLGIVTVQVGFAPLKPAEFVIVQISQKTGQTA